MWSALGESDSPKSSQTDRLKSLIHDTEDFGDPLAVQAQCAAIALCYAAESAAPSGADAAAWSAHKVIEALENYVAFTNDRLHWGGAGRSDTTLLDRELRKQNEDLESVSSLSQPRLPEVKGMRLRNRWFSIPIAV
jgi:hypothetical protein